MLLSLLKRQAASNSTVANLTVLEESNDFIGCHALCLSVTARRYSASI